MTPRINFEGKFISPELSSFLVDLSMLLDKHGVEMSFEAETIKGQGSLMTIRCGEETAEIEVESPDAFDLDPEMINHLFKTLVVLPH